MKWRALRLLLGITLLFGLSAGAMGTGSAESHHLGSTSLYFPWIPHGAMLGESGPYFGAVTIQNLEEEPITIHPFVLTPPSGEPTEEIMSLSLDAFESTTLTSTDLGLNVRAPGSAVFFDAYRVSDGQPAKVAGVQKQTAPEAPTVDSGTGANHDTVAGYTALGMDEFDNGEIGPDIVLPIVQTNSGWNTIVRVSDFIRAPGTHSFSMTLYEAGSGNVTAEFTESFRVGETVTFDLRAMGIPPGWVGSARITADGDIGAVAERVKPETDMLIINTSRPVLTGGNHVANIAPLILREWNNWNTGISIANLVDRENTVSVTYYATDGSVVDVDELTVPPLGMDFIYTPSTVTTAEGQGFVGSAMLTAASPFQAAVDEVKYFGNAGDTGHAMSYMVERPPDPSGASLVMPLVQKGDPATGLGDTTGIQLFNSHDSDAAAVGVWFFDRDGNPVSDDPVEVTLESHEGYTLYTMDVDVLPPGFQGTAIIKRLDRGNARVSAASNNVNYEVQYDGSASFTLPVTSNLFGAQQMTLARSGGSGPIQAPLYGQETTVTATLTDRFGNPAWWEGVVFEIDNFEQAGFVRGGELEETRSTFVDANGRATVTVRLRDEALGDRPLDSTITATVEGTELTEQLTITWQVQEVQPAGLQGTGD